MADFFNDKFGGCSCTRSECSDECSTYRNFKPKPQTNADRIRSMTDEELALYLSENANGDCPIIEDCPDGMQEKTVCTPSECWLSWLKAPAEEGE